MEAPPPIPNAKPPLTRAFYLWLCVPVASMVLAAALSAAGGRNSALEAFGTLLSFVSVAAMVVGSIVCSVMVGKRKGGWIGMLTFIGIQVVYVAVAFAGCAAMIGRMDFR
ncbi:MAG: hypothetical protein K8R23_18470 [Chthoniobacter sp.]|nr:hypothetical protein [Chthoniobacter sp.]